MCVIDFLLSVSHFFWDTHGYQELDQAVFFRVSILWFLTYHGLPAEFVTPPLDTQGRNARGMVLKVIKRRPIVIEILGHDG